ncbi:MAG: molybdopterin-guanine dinucleotide biosynthesis protein MobB [Promethearchaeia archaeon]
MKKINFIGLSGSGKTYIIETLISLLEERFNLKSAVVKNIHLHQMDTEGKDTHRYGEAGANFSITKNIHGETTIFVKKDLSIEKLEQWIGNGPFPVDIFIAEGFRDLEVPTVLCVRKVEKIEEQITRSTKVISGLITRGNRERYGDFPIIDIDKDPEPFFDLLGLSD